MKLYKYVRYKIRQMIKEGLPFEVISELTGVSLKKVKEAANDRR